MNDKEMTALTNVLKYFDGEKEHYEMFGQVDPPSENTWIHLDTLQEYLDYQTDMDTEARVSNDAKRAAANEYAKERS